MELGDLVARHIPALEAHQLVMRLLKGIPLIAHIELHDLIAASAAAVLHFHPHIDAVLDCCRREILIVEPAVSQAVSKGIPGRRLHEPVGPVCHMILGKLRHGLSVIVEGNRQLSGGIGLSEEDVGQRFSTPLPGIPCLNNGGNLVLVGAQIQSASAVDDQHHRFPQGDDALDQNLLRLRQQQVLLVAGGKGVALVPLLALQALIQTHAQNDHIRILYHGLRLAQKSSRPAQRIVRRDIEVAALAVENADLISHRPADAIQIGYVLVGIPVIVAIESRLTVCVGSDHADGLQALLLQRENAVIFQQHHGLLRRGKGRLLVLRLRHHPVGNLIVGAVLVEHPQSVSCGKEPHCRAADLLLGNQPLLQSGQQALIGAAAVQIASHPHRQGRGFLRPGRVFVGLMEIPYRPAVGDHMPLKSPLAPEDIHQKPFASAARFPVGAVVGAHNRLHVRVLYRGLKGRQIGLPQIFLAHHSVKFVAQSLRPGVYGKMLGAGRDLQILPVSLQPLDEGVSQLAGQRRILPVGLMAPSPPGITENVDIGGPVGQSLINIPVSRFLGRVVLRPGLLGDDLRLPLQKIRIKGRRHADGLWKHGGNPRPAHTVERLVPPVVLRHTQPLDGRRVMQKLRCRLLHGHLRHQFLGLSAISLSVHCKPPFYLHFIIYFYFIPSILFCQTNFPSFFTAPI